MKIRIRVVIIITLLAVIAAGVTAHFGSAPRHTDTVDSWYVEPPQAVVDLFGGHGYLDSRKDRTIQAFPVTDAQRSLAIARLAQAKYVPLSVADAGQFTGAARETGTGRGSWYLVRAFQSCTVRTSHGYLWMDCGLLTHYDVPMERYPVVVHLPKPPRDVFLTFSEAE